MQLDWSAIGTIASIILASLSLALSIYTYVRTERRQKQQEIRQFLVEISDTSTRLTIALHDFIREPSLEILSTRVMPVIHELSQTAPRARTWRQETFYPAFQSIEHSIHSFADAMQTLIQAGDIEAINRKALKMIETSGELHMQAQRNLMGS